MMSRSKFAAFAGALILAGSAFANHQSICPNLADIQAEGLAFAEEIGQNFYISYNISNFNTNDNWGFVIAPIEADSTEEAIETGNDILDEMTAPGVPEEQAGAFVCTYETGRPNVIAAAIQSEEQITPLKLKQLVRAVR